MASLFKQNDGSWRVEFSIEKNRRRYIRLGRITRADAEQARSWITRLVSAAAMATSPDAEASRWLSGLPDALHDKLARAKLCPVREKTQGVSLGEFLERCKANLTCSPATAVFYGHTVRNLRDFYGPDKPLADIGPADADAFRTYLSGPQGLSPATTARRIIACRTFFKRAVRWELLPRNVFDGVKGGLQTNESRKVFVSQETIAKILDACPDQEWRLIITLARYAGIRVPSELLPLQWGDINWAQNSIRITSPKTAHHAGGGYRTIPLFAELRPALLQAFEAAADGQEYVIARYRDTTQNLRTQFERIALRAGVTMWSKPFHNLRASRESELMRQYDLATVCRWIGNSPTIAAQHYATSIDLNSDFKRAAGQAENAPDGSAVKSAVKSAVVYPGVAMQGHEAKTENRDISQDCIGMHVSACEDMGLNGFEPLTSSLSVTRSNQLSYKPEQPCKAPPADSKGLLRFARSPDPLSSNDLSLKSRAGRADFSGCIVSPRLVV